MGDVLKGRKYYEAGDAGYNPSYSWAILYHRRKRWAMTKPLPGPVFYRPPSMRKPWRHNGRMTFLYRRKRFKWEEIYA